MSLKHRLSAGGSVQALVLLDESLLVAGLQGGKIIAWSTETFQLVLSIRAHDEGVLGLFVSDDGQLLFSSGADSIVNVWSTFSFNRLYTIKSTYDIGDVFCVVYSSTLKTVFCGSQDQSISWHALDSEEIVPTRPSDTFSNGGNIFFDRPRHVTAASLPTLDNGQQSSRELGGHQATFRIWAYKAFAHAGYIYSMLLVKGLFHHSPDEEVLITCAGDGSVKLWGLDSLPEGLIELDKFKNEGLSALSMTYSDGFLYVGMSDGKAMVCNLDSRQIIQILDVKCDDVGAVQVVDGHLICGTNGGYVKQLNPQFAELRAWPAHNGKILGSSIIHKGGKDLLILGGSDDAITFWDVTPKHATGDSAKAYGNDDMLLSLEAFVAFKSVSSNPACKGECNKAATYLRKLFNRFDATTVFLAGSSDCNPILLANFGASTPHLTTKTVLLYGHYDVVEADAGDSEWLKDPFQLHPLNGYLYGRGVSDNKGPILAALYAVAELRRTRALSCNVSFLIEGEEEAGSKGLRRALIQNQRHFGEVDYILLSNSVWLEDHVPCLTYGMRGVIHARATVASGRGDLHSGVDGKLSAFEPMKDLIHIMSSLTMAVENLTDIRGFYDGVEQKRAGDLIACTAITLALHPGHPEIESTASFTKSLLSRWHEPSITVHSIEVPRSKDTVTIPRSATARFSIRIVPGQEAKRTATAVCKFLRDLFSRGRSTNALKVEITSTADAWLGDRENEIYSTLEKAVTDTWAPDDKDATTRIFPAPPGDTTLPLPVQKTPPRRRASTLASKGNFTVENFPEIPLFIREGGSNPAIALLERHFGKPAAMFPMGQSTDNAHLANERMRIENLYKGREVLKKVFARL